MKRALSVILAALLLASSVVSCGQNQTSESAETAISETAAETVSETVSSETPDASLSYDTNTVTENGIAKAHIVLFDGADSIEKKAADELGYHIKLISGADIAVTNAAQADSLPIIIATPESFPELEELFPEDLAWLRDLGDGSKVRWGDDGFAIRQKDGKLYIFGATSRGALNGVYDFIEDSMGVLWIRAANTSEYPIIYDEIPTIDGIKADYREKSPFALRGWTLNWWSEETASLLSRNKLNTNTESIDINFISGHNIKSWITSSPSYDPNCSEYWSTDANGNHYTHEDATTGTNFENTQVNFWSDLTVQCIADAILVHLDLNYDAYKNHYIGVSLMDSKNISVYPEMLEPYEYAPGQFIDRSSGNYISTVYFTFINKIARIVAEKYPDVKLHAYAYMETLEAPECTLDYNVYATFCPIDEDLSSTIDNPDKTMSYVSYKQLLKWFEKTPNVQVYNYYGCFAAAPFYTRAIWNRMQSDIQLYAANGFNGLVPEGFADVDKEMYVNSAFYILRNEIRDPYLNMTNVWEMNALTFWLYSKLAWNPYEDVDALIEYYCDKVYGDAAEYMIEYYHLLEISWTDGGEAMAMEFNNNFLWWTGLETIWDYFLNIEVDGVHILTAIQENLHKAYDAADERGKAHIQYMMENYDQIEYLTWGE